MFQGNILPPLYFLAKHTPNAKGAINVNLKAFMLFMVTLCTKYLMWYLWFDTLDVQIGFVGVLCYVYNYIDCSAILIFTCKLNQNTIEYIKGII